jgi:hypothetical protein
VFDVEKGWLGTSEINAVTYDSDKVTLEQLELWLKKSGTYIRTVPVPRKKARSEATGQK